MKLLLVLNGESYRIGSQFSRGRGRDNYIERQMLACNSHITLINEIKNKFNIDTDVIIYTYKLNKIDDDNLIKIYEDNNINIISVEFLNSICRNEDEFMRLTYDKTTKYLSNYHCCMLVRMDIYLKDFFIQNIILDDKIRFPHIDVNSNTTHINETKKMPVGYNIIYFPQKYFFVIQNKIIYNTGHQIYNRLIDYGIPDSEIDFYVYTFHISSTDIASNPIFCNVGRKYVIKYETGCLGDYFLYDKLTNSVFLDKNLTMLKWNNEYTNKDEDILLSNICY